MNVIEDTFTSLGHEVLVMEAKNSPSNSHTVSVRLETHELAKIDSLSELLSTTRQEIFSNILSACFDEAIRGAHKGLQIELDERGSSQIFDDIFQEKFTKLNSKLSK